MQESEDIKFMQRCLDLAVKAEGNTYPNPLVGSVIVHNGRIIGEGYHRKAGESHAERIAIGTVVERELLKESTLYVNLEPCSHFGRTPPCSDLIIASGIKKVVAGTIDTSDKVSGKGITALRNAGCQVITGVLENECRWINRRFFTFHEKKRPYVILKWAQSSDGFLDIERGNFPGERPVWITGKAEKVLVHKWRAAEQSILVGAGTIRADNPLLNVRDWSGKDPLKLILSSTGRIDSESEIFKTGGKVVIFTHNRELRPGYNAEVIIMDRDIPSAKQVLSYLFDSGIQSLFIEGGAAILNHFINEGLWDEARIFHGNFPFGSGVTAPTVRGLVYSRTIYSASCLEIIIKREDQYGGKLSPD